MNKVLLFKAFKDMLPPDFGTREKRGFLMPHKHWMNTVLSDRINETFSSAKATEFFKKKHLDKLLTDFKQNRMSWHAIWTLFILFEWCEKYNVSLGE
jgi:hypothetical protein